MNARAKALHALNRLAYGPRPGDVERLATGGDEALHAWVDSQLHPESISDDAALEKLAWFSSLKMSPADIGKKFHFLGARNPLSGIPDSEDLNDPQVRLKHYDIDCERLRAELMAKRVVLAVDSKRQLNELLFEFWWNHFNVDWTKALWTATAYERDAIRPNLFGKFRDLLGATAHHPAMLEYLDNVHNISQSKGQTLVNENYARELMELHTVGVDGGYSQKDVFELARIFTGWGQNEASRAFEFRPEKHDSGRKSWLGQSFEGTGGKDEGERALDFLAKQPATSRFIATKLVRFFVSDQPEPALVARIAQRFQETDGNLREVYVTLFRSQEFWDERRYSSKTKRPFQYIASAIREVGGEINKGMAGRRQVIYRFLDGMGEPIHTCPFPNGYSEDPKVWINPGGMVQRMNFAVQLASGKVWSVSLPEGSQAKAERLASPEFQKR